MSLSQTPAGPIRSIAYFSMEIALGDEIPTFSGGLGVLAGDLLKAASDMALPMVGVTLLYHHGHFRQELDGDGRQLEHPVSWTPADHLEHLDTRVKIEINGRSVIVGVWRRLLRGVGGSTVPVYFLDTLVLENAPADQVITDRLYIGDRVQRLSQEAILGLAGPAMLRALGHGQISTFHLNEGHASLVPVALLRDSLGGTLKDVSAADLVTVRERCVFTTHTPVPAGHDRFEMPLVTEVLGQELADGLEQLGCLADGVLNMTVLGMFFSGFVNAVAQRHREVSQAMFPLYRMHAVTNGVHVGTWVAPSTEALFDRYLSEWREDNNVLRFVSTIPLDEIRSAHARAKKALLGEVARRAGVRLDPDVLTVGVARRVTPYKRNDLLLSRPEELRSLVRRIGPLQVVYSGKAHPADGEGKVLIERINTAARELAGDVTVVYLEDYGMSLAAVMVAGVDIWLNNPVAPHEASGTSGMKAALNGVPSLSVLDGWWVEGCVEGVTGWAIGTDRGADSGLRVGDPVLDEADGSELYRVLGEVATCYYEHPESFAAARRHTISLNGSFFTAQRMVSEYAARAYTRSQPSG
ncbi:MAG: alpha-glucan family phosphorylase [Acidimicrobiales bacterium]|jgi:glycogen phosphorylase